MPEHNKQSGMTLVEILVGLVMMGIVVTGIYNLFRVHNIMAVKQDETTRMQQELLTALVVMSDDLRMCGYTPINSDENFGLIVQEINDRATNSSSVYCTKGSTTNSTISLDIAYRMGNGNSLLSYVASNGTWEIVASNISDLRFTYFDRDEDEVIAPTNASIKEIRMIEINATAIPSPERAALGINSRNMHTRVWLRNLDL